MRLYLLRHGIADDGRPGMSDSDRELTPEGRKRLRDTLRMAARSGVSPTLIVSSPYLRATQTAQVAADELKYKADILTTDSLIPSSDPEAVWQEIRVHKNEREMVLVGHEPLFGRLAAFLLSSPNLFIDVKKGSVIRIDVDEFGPQPRGVLKWMLVAKMAAT